MGSAVQRAFLKINDAVLEGGDTLGTFAKQAGMSSSDFKKAWQDDAAHALIPFLKGLNDTHEAGGNVNAVLKELGISSVNELNTLLVLAGGYDQLAGNLEMASNAYNETEESMMALNKEAELAYGTTLGKLRTAWNRLKDSLIDIGEPIADAVLDMVDAAEPLFKVVEDLATGFSNLDETAQRDIISTVAKIALIAPALKIAGGAMTTLGDIFKVGAGVTRKAGEIITKAMFGVAGEAATLTTVAGTAAGSKGVGGLIASLAGSAGLPWALGIAAVALGGWTLWKVWGEDAYEAAEQTKLWGRTVSDETHETLTSFQELSAGVRDATDEMANDVESGGKKAVQGYESMMEGIVSTADEKLEDITGFYEDLNTSARHILKESTETHAEELEKIKGKAEEKYSEINGIYEKALSENRRLTNEELQRVEKLHADLAKLQAEVAGGTAEQIRQTQASLMNDLKAMSEEQLLERRELLREDLAILKEHHDKELEEIDSRVASGNLKFEKGEEAKLAIRQAHSREVQRIMDEQIKAFEASGMDEEAILLELMDQYSEYGYTRMDIERKVQEVMRGTQDETYELDRMWRNLLTDPVTGEVNTNLPDVLADMYESDETWQELHYMIKEADLSSNALEIIDEALVANGLWDELDPEIKVLLTDNRVFMHKLSQSEEALNRWNELPEEEKWILGNNHDLALEIMDSEKMYNAWLNLPEVDKLLLGNNSDLLREILSSEKEYNRWLRLPEKEKRLLANNSQVYESVNNAQKKLNSLKDKSVTITTRNQTIYESIYRAQGNKASSNWVQSGGRILHARGTDFHPGGMAMVNDQSGALFRELVTLPDGQSFIPKGRNVMLDLPKGSKVLRAALTKMKFPDIKQYKDGVGYSKQQTQQIMSSNNTDMSQTNNLLTTLIDMVRKGQVIQMDGNEVGRTVYSAIDGTMTRNMQRNQAMNMQGG